MTDLFPRAGFLRTGYHRGQVDAFFAKARAAYERPSLDETAMSALDVRTAAFDLKTGGYKLADVDLALDRLEAAFAARSRDQFVRANGQQAWMQLLSQRAQVLYPRLRRPLGKRFDPPAMGKRGYDARQVDALLGRLIEFFDKGTPLTPEELREATFARRGKRGGYNERTVDAFIARSVDIIMGAQ